MLYTSLWASVEDSKDWLFCSSNCFTHCPLRAPDSGHIWHLYPQMSLVIKISLYFSLYYCYCLNLLKTNVILNWLGRKSKAWKCLKKKKKKAAHSCIFKRLSFLLHVFLFCDSSKATPDCIEMFCYILCCCATYCDILLE